MKVTARATRSGSWWAVTVLEVDGAFTQARRLDQVPDMVRDAVSLLTGDAPDSIDVDVVPTTGAEDLLAQLRERRAAAAEAQDAASTLTRQLVADLTGNGYTVRDVAELLEISPQRVSQLSAR